MRITKIKAGWRTASLSEQLLDGPLTEMRQRILREAQSEGLWPLTDEHWDVIHFVLDYYWKHHQSPVAVRVGRSLGMGVRQLPQRAHGGLLRQFVAGGGLLPGTDGGRL